MKRKAYSVDEKLFGLLREENFDKLNTGELQKLFDNSPHEISDKWVFISDKTEREYQKEFENYQIGFFFRYQGLYGYRYFSLVDYENNSTYKIGIPDVSSSDDGVDRQKCVTIELESDDIIDVKKYVFNKLASGTQITNYLINNKKQVLIKSFTDFFHDEFGKIQNQAKRNHSPTEDKDPFFVTYNVDPEQFQDHKNVVAEKLHILKDIMDINIKEVFFKPYADKDLIALINMETKTMDLVRAINEYIRGDASLYLEWGDPVRYNRFDSQMLSQYREEEVNTDNIKNVEQLIASEIRGFSGDWYDNESLVLSSKSCFYFRSRQLIDKICNLLRDFVSFIYNNILKILKLGFQKLYRCCKKIFSYIPKNTWIQIALSYTFLAIVTGAFQALFSSLTVRAWFYALFQRFFPG
ncbi:MAG: hypothetical protein OXG97_06365 [Candidatus Poribacteria bacterium]|nr:hypothetical protein [Candidatus Poribacteria bacterium]